jgi:hypothetical protein
VECSRKQMLASGCIWCVPYTFPEWRLEKSTNCPTWLFSKWPTTSGVPSRATCARMNFMLELVLPLVVMLECVVKHSTLLGALNLQDSRTGNSMKVVNYLQCSKRRSPRWSSHWWIWGCWSILRTLQTAHWQVSDEVRECNYKKFAK